MSVPDPYKVLQVDPAAEDEVIEAAYRRLARKHHPDVSPGPESQARMVQLNRAWDLLRDPARRAAVDRARARAGAPPPETADGDPGSTPPRTPAPARPAPGRTTPPSAPRGSFDASPDRRADGDAGWPFPGMRDPHDIDVREPRPETVSRDRTSGRSSTDSGYDASTMGTGQGEGRAGPPPGNPSGSVLWFGRYAGWSLGEVARVDLDYLDWLDRMPVGRAYRDEIDARLRAAGRRRSAAPDEGERRGLFRRR